MVIDSSFQKKGQNLPVFLQLMYPPPMKLPSNMVPKLKLSRNKASDWPSARNKASDWPNDFSLEAEATRLLIGQESFYSIHV